MDGLTLMGDLMSDTLMEQTLTVDKVAVLVLHPGDTLVVTLPDGASAEYHHRAHELIKAWLDDKHPGCELLLTPHGTGLTVTRPADA